MHDSWLPFTTVLPPWSVVTYCTLLITPPSPRSSLLSPILTTNMHLLLMGTQISLLPQPARILKLGPSTFSPNSLSTLLCQSIACSFYFGLSQRCRSLSCFHNENTVSLLEMEGWSESENWKKNVKFVTVQHCNSDMKSSECLENLLNISKLKLHGILLI